MLDELPYGDFVEIEGENVEEINTIAAQLFLGKNKAIETSYLSLFERVAEKKKLNINSLSFETFENWKPSPEELSVLKADEEE